MPSKKRNVISRREKEFKDKHEPKDIDGALMVYGKRLKKISKNKN